MFSNKKCATVSMLQSVTGATSSHRVRYFVFVMMYLAPDLLAGGLIGPMKSMTHLSKSCNVTCGFNGSHPFWRDFQPFDKHHMSDSIPLLPVECRPP
jgi:hypothetical protein